MLGDLFVMLAQPNLGVQRHAQLFVSRWDAANEALVPVATSVVSELDLSIAWAVY